LIGELNNFISGLGRERSVKYKEVLEKAFRVKKGMKRIDYQKAPPEVMEIEGEVDQLLSTDYSGYHRKLQAFIKRHIKQRESILTFLQYEGVPADNNGSEGGIRNEKVKIKVSGQFLNAKGADRFAKIHSVIDTAIKSSQNVFVALGALSG
jgi:hypothetical protein